MSHGKKSKRKRHKKQTELKNQEAEEHLDKRPPHIDITGTVEATFPSDLVEKYDTAGKKEEGWNLKIFIAEIVAAFLLAASVAAVAWQGFLIRESNRISRESLEAVQRSFIIFQKVEGGKFNLRSSSGDLSSALSFKATWQNVGATPAISVLNNFVQRDLQSEPDNETFETPPADYQLTYIGPKDSRDTGMIFKPLSFIPVDPTKTEKHYFWGWVIYRDTLTGTRLHLTEFCEILLSTSVPPKDFGSVELFSSECKQHNCADQDCEDYKEITDMVKTKVPKLR